MTQTKTPASQTASARKDSMPHDRVLRLAALQKTILVGGKLTEPEAMELADLQKTVVA